MPTGYTYQITSEKGIKFKDFVMECSKAFLIRMRDRSGDVPERFEVDNYHLERIEEAIKEQEKFSKLTDMEKQAQWVQEAKGRERARDGYNKKNAEEKKKYEDMLLKVKNWTPPTDKHNGLKDFMIEQIEGSIKFDIHDWDSELLKPFAKWLESMYDSLEHNLKYHSEEHKKEVKRVNDMNKWIKDLRDSL